MNQNETLDFSNVAPAEGGGLYLKPGVYYAKPSAVELVQKEGSSAAIKVSFTAVSDEYAGQSVDEKFFLTEKALPRLQYLHEKYLGFRLENAAITFKKLADYLSNKLLTKPKTIALVVGGNEKDGKVYGQLPFTDFIVEDTSNLEEGPFKEGSPEYLRVVRKARNAATASAAPILSGGVASDNTKMPWED